MTGSKVLKLMLDDHGSYLGMKKGCFTLKDKHGKVERYPLFEQEIGETIENRRMRFIQSPEEDT